MAQLTPIRFITPGPKMDSFSAMWRGFVEKEMTPNMMIYTLNAWRMGAIALLLPQEVVDEIQRRFSEENEENST